MSGRWKGDAGRIVVVKDAAYRDGCAVLAVVGDLGTRVLEVDAASATEAEELALLLAMDVAEGRENVDFISDRNPVPRDPRVIERLAANPTWRVVAVPRRWTWEAHRLAKRGLGVVVLRKHLAPGNRP